MGHDLEPRGTPVDTHQHSRPFDSDAHVRVDDVIAALIDVPDWGVEVHDKRHQPARAAAPSRHVADIVLRARRTAA